MGLMKFIARRGAVGGTARIIGKQYKRLRQLHPNKDVVLESEIYKLIIKERFMLFSNKFEEELLLGKTYSMKGLVDLVREILGVEAGYYRNTFQNQILFESVIIEELQKQGINESEL